MLTEKYSHSFIFFVGKLQQERGVKISTAVTITGIICLTIITLYLIEIWSKK